MRFWDFLKTKYRRYQRTHGYACDACKTELFFYPKQRLCTACENTLYANDGNVCIKCGRKTVTDGVCLDCKMKTPAFTVGVSPFVYQGKTAGLVNRMKNGNRRLPIYFGERMADELLTRFPTLKEEFPIGRYALNEAVELCILPVPITKERLRERGYNQAEELALNVEERLKELGVAAKTYTDVLLKIQDGRSQKILDYKERETQAKSVYHVHKRAFCKGKLLLLVDDILTTGATSSTCAEMLLNAGAKAVYVLCAASLSEHANALKNRRKDE